MEKRQSMQPTCDRKSWEGVRPQRSGDYVSKYCDMLNRARISGCFYTQYNEDYDKGYGLYNPMTRRRKKGFYMYKSYERAS